MVLIVDTSGRIAARTTFTAPPAPVTSLACGLIMPPVIRVARDDKAAFYLDSSGALNRIDPSGANNVVAKLVFPSRNVIVSFGAHPEGKALMAIVISLTDSGRWSLDLENAVAGGQTTIGYHRDLGTDFPNRLTEITGWDNGGPVAALNSLTCVQQAPISLEYTGDALVRLSQDGSHVGRIGGSDCIPWDETPNAFVLCGTPDGSFTVRNDVGGIYWGSSVRPYREPRLHPYGYQVAFDGGTATILTPTSQRPASSARQTSPTYRLLGWADDHHIAVVREDGHLGLEYDEGEESFTDLGLDVGKLCAGCGTQSVYLAGTIGIP